MKKFIIIAVALVAVAAGVYLYKNKSSDGGVISTVANSFGGASGGVVAEYVPADTVLYIGNLKSMDYKKAMELSRNMGFDFSSFMALVDQDEFKLDEHDPDAAKFALGLYKAYLTVLSDSPEKIGVNSELQTALYVNGALPVFRVALDGSQTMSTLISDIEKENNITAKVGNVNGVEYREYSFDENSPENSPASLVVAIADNQLVVTINTLLDDTKDLAVALGTTKPAKNITDSASVNRLVSENGYLGYSFFFVDNLEITKGLTDPSANSFGKMLGELTAAYGDANAFAELQTPACKAEYTALVANWPTLSADYTKLESKSASFKMLLEGTNADLIESLTKLQGHLSPMLDNQDYLFSMGMGVDMANFTGVVTDVWKRLTKEPFNCEPLTQMQAELKESNPMQLGLFTSMLGGIKGVGFAVAEMDFDGLQQAQNNPMAAAESMSLFMTVSADDPMALLQLAGMQMPQLASFSLEDGGESKNLPLPVPVEVKATLRGHDLVLSFGDTANEMAANLKSNSSLENNGLFSFNMDMGAYFGMIDQAMQMEGAKEQLEQMDEEQKKIFEMFKNVKGKVSEKINFSKEGFVVDVEMSVD